MILNAEKASPAALLKAAKNSIDIGQHFEAERYLQEALRRDATNHSAMFLLAETYAAQGLVVKAGNFYMMAMRTNPGELSYKQSFINFVGRQRASAYSKPVGDILVECFKEKNLDCTRVRVFWLEHLCVNPEFHAAFSLRDRKFFDPENKEFFEKISDYRPIFTPYFLLGIKNVIVSHPVFEEFLTHLRNRLLENKFTAEESLALADALAHYSFHTDFIFDCTEDELKFIDVLRDRIESGHGDALSIAMYACYVPLYTLKNADRILQEFSSSPDIADILKLQITDYNVLRETARSITAITPIDNAVSAEVREQYEEFPYPRWRAFSPAGLVDSWETTDGGKNIVSELRRKRAKILNAGCGTGQEAIVIATVFSRADVLAVDLSRTSLAYATNKAKEYNIQNVTFRQADILQLGSLDQKFDYISSAGVLHHMKEPLKGWQVLCDLLKPGGMMTIGLYSKIARKDVLKMQEIARNAGYAKSSAGMKAFRKNSLQFVPPSVLENVAYFLDYYVLSMYRDLLFHVQEYDYDLQEIDGILKQLNLNFIGFSMNPFVLKEYAKQFPEDRSKTNLANWHLFEQKYPSTFKHMYLFWCQKGKPRREDL